MTEDSLGIKSSNGQRQIEAMRLGIELPNGQRQVEKRSFHKLSVREVLVRENHWKPSNYTGTSGCGFVCHVHDNTTLKEY